MSYEPISLVLDHRTGRTITGRCSRDENGALHNDGAPAVIWDNGHLVWKHHGVSHREDGPASELPNGDFIYFVDGKWHREDGPSFRRTNPTTGEVSELYYLNDRLVKN